MKRNVTLIIALFAIGTAFGQSGKILKDAGIKKLNVFIGTWKSQSIDTTDKSFAVYTCRWSANGQFLVADQIVTDKNNSKSNNLAVYSYNSAKDKYLLSIVGIPGVDPFAIPVTYKGDELTYSSDYMENGAKVYNRTLNIFKSPSLYIYRVQSSKDSANWVTSIEGKAVKIAE